MIDGTNTGKYGCELSILMPCLNEAETLAICIDKAQAYLKKSGIDGEVIIGDNGSTDGSQEIARQHGARVIDVPQRGYGAALMGGIAGARGRYIIMGDSDDSYDFSNLDAYVNKLREGYELVMGNRFLGGIKPGAMPPLHRYLGNPVLSFVGRLFFGSPANDFHCGLRGFHRDAIRALKLQTPGMEFASEMVVKASLQGLKICEVPTTLSPDGRSRPPHLRTWRDGWRHLRFLLMYSPRWLYAYPGLLATGVGLFGLLALLGGPLTVGSVTFDIHAMLLTATLVILGVQALTFGWISKLYGLREGFLPPDPVFEFWYEKLTLEVWVFGGLFLFLSGLIGIIGAVVFWSGQEFGDLNPQEVMRYVVPAMTATIVGIQGALGGFMASILEIRVPKR